MISMSCVSWSGQTRCQLQPLQLWNRDSGISQLYYHDLLMLKQSTSTHRSSGQIAEECYKMKMSLKPGIVKAYRKLSTVLLCDVVMFNRRRSGEADRMPVTAYNSRTCDVNMDVTHGLSPLEIKLCEDLSSVQTCGKSKKGKVPVPVTILLTTSMVSDINLMISKRQAVGGREDNPYLFARSTGRTSLIAFVKWF